MKIKRPIDYAKECNVTDQMIKQQLDIEEEYEIRREIVDTIVHLNCLLQRGKKYGISGTVTSTKVTIQNEEVDQCTFRPSLG